MDTNCRVYNADGTAVMISYGVWRCLICGEIYLGTECPSNCPFCGAHIIHIIRPPEGGNPKVIDVGDAGGELTEKEKENLDKSIETEYESMMFYSFIAKKAGPVEVRGIFKRLARVESEHLSLFCKLRGVKKPTSPPKPMSSEESWSDVATRSSRMETNAHSLYVKFAKETDKPRLMEVWGAVAQVELDHMALSISQSKFLSKETSEKTDK